MSSIINQYSRIKHHTITTGATFTVPTQEDFTLVGSQSWTPTDVALSEIGVDELNKKAFIRIGDGIKEFLFDKATDVDWIDFNLTGATDSIPEGRLVWNPEFNTLSLGLTGGVEYELGQENFFLVKNQTGGPILKGEVVGFAGTLGASGRILGQKFIADGTYPSDYVMGVAAGDIQNGEDGFVTNFGKIRKIDTTGATYGLTFSSGDLLWASPTIPGGYTNVEPEAPNQKILMAAVIYADNNNGSIIVRPTFNGKLNDIDDVKILATPSNGQVLTYNASQSYWEPSSNFSDLEGTLALGNTTGPNNIILSDLGNNSSYIIDEPGENAFFFSDKSGTTAWNIVAGSSSTQQSSISGLKDKLQLRSTEDFGVAESSLIVMTPNSLQIETSKQGDPVLIQQEYYERYLITTTNSTPIDIFTYSYDSGKIMYFEADLTAVNQLRTEASYDGFFSVVRRDIGGVLHQVSTVDQTTKTEFTTASASFGFTGSTVYCKVSGESGTTINWELNIKYRK